MASKVEPLFLLENLGVVHADLCGPMKTKSLGGSRYFFNVY